MKGGERVKKHFTAMVTFILCLTLWGNTTYIVQGEELPMPSENPMDYTAFVRGNDFLEYIEINGLIAYCMNLGDTSPSEEKYKHPNQVVIDGVGEIVDVDMMKKLLYYGYGGPGYNQPLHNGTHPIGGSSAARRNTITAYNIHRAAHGEYSEKKKYDGDRFPEVLQEWADISVKELPDWDFNLVQAEGEVTLVTENEVEWQRSPQFHLEGGPPGNSVNIPIGEPFQLRKVATGEVFTAESLVEIGINEAFWIEAPKNYEGIFETGDLESTMFTKMRLIVLKWNKEDMQRIVVAEYYNGTTSMSVIFPGFLNRVEVEKRDAEDENILLNEAKFILFKRDVDETVYYYQRETKTWVLDKELASVLETNGNGKVGVQNLPIGDYYFEEIEAAPGYILPEDENERIFPTAIGSEGKVAKVTAFNEKIPGSTVTPEPKITPVPTEPPFQLPFTGLADLRGMNIIGIILMILGIKAYKKIKTNR